MNLDEYYIKSNENDRTLAQKVGLNQPTLWRIRNKKVTPRAETAAKIQEATGGKVTVLELLYPDREHAA